MNVPAARATASAPVPRTHFVTLAGVAEGRATVGADLVSAYEAYERVAGDSPAARFGWDAMSGGAGVLAVEVVAPLMVAHADKWYWLGAIIGGPYGRRVRRRSH